MLLGSWLIYIRYERWVIFLLGSPDHCLTHHSIIGDMTFSYCIDMDWSSFIPLSYCLCISSSISKSSFHFLSISYILIHIFVLIPSSHHSHVSLMVWLLIFLSFRHRHFLWLPLGPWLMRFFLCITSYTWGYGFDHWVFEPSFPSFLSPYHPGLRYVLCLKTTLRPWDQMLSLTAST